MDHGVMQRCPTPINPLAWRALFPERRPLAMRNAALSVRNFRRSLRMLEALGVHPELGTSSALIGQLVRSPLPLGVEGGVSGVVSSLLYTEERAQKALRLGRSQLRSLRHPGHPYGDARVRLLHRLLDEGGGLPLLFPQHDVGFSYDQAVPHGGRASSPVAILPHEKAANSTSPSTSRLRIGARMPHFLLRPHEEFRRDVCGINDKLQPLSVSTVDLPDQIRRAFLSGRHAGRGGGINAPYGVLYAKAAAEAGRASLMCVLLVTAGKCASGSRNGDSVERVDGPEGAAFRWRTIATQAGRQLSEYLSRQTEMVDSPLLLPPSLVIIEVFPCSLDAGVSTPYGRVGWVEKPTPCLNKPRPEEVSHTAKVVRDGGHLTIDGHLRKRVELHVPLMYTFDDRCGDLHATFEAEEVEAVLLRPDGHIAWAASCGTSRRTGWDSSSDYNDHGELADALKTVYAWVN